MGRTRIGAGSAAIVALAAVCSAAVAAPPRRIALSVSLIGSGSVHLSTGQHVSCKTGCTKTFLVREGRVITLSAQPTQPWKLLGWQTGCHTDNKNCTLPVYRPSHASVTFLRPGDRRNPIAVGLSAPVGDNWSLQVASVTPDATAQVDAIKDGFGELANTPPPPGAQDFLVLLSATYTGGGSGDLGQLMNSLYTMGVHNAEYDMGTSDCGFLPTPDLGNLDYSSVFSGQTVKGNVCWQIASNDASTLEMTYLDNPQTWFALR